MATTPQPQELSLEEKLAAIAAGIALASETVRDAEKPKAFACPVDPQLREMCQGCQ